MPARRSSARPSAKPSAKPTETMLAAARAALAAVQAGATQAAARRIWIIVPTYDERDNVGPITAAILETVPQANVLIVDDNSPDGTGALADELAVKDSRIAVLHREAKQGLGRAYVDAFRDVLARGAEVVVQVDADFSHPVRFLPSLLEPVMAGRAHLVLGSRYVKGGHIPRWNLLRRIVSRGGSIFAGVVLLLPFKDLTGGFKAWRSNALAAIDLDRLHAGGYAFQIEMTFRARQAGAIIVETPITFEERRVGKSKMSMAIFTEAFWLVVGLRLRNLLPHRRGKLSTDW